MNNSSNTFANPLEKKYMKKIIVDKIYSNLSNTFANPLEKKYMKKIIVDKIYSNLSNTFANPLANHLDYINLSIIEITS